MKSIRTLSCASVVGIVMVIAASSAHADPVEGKVGATHVINGEQSKIWGCTLRGGETTLISLTGDGDTCLELRVYDQDDRLVTSDTRGLGDKRMVLVIPPRTGVYKIKVSNLGRVANEYVIVAE